MKLILTLSVLTLMTYEAKAGIDVVYGTDNRQDIYQVTNELHKKLAESTAGMISLRQIQKSIQPGYFDIYGAQTLERGQNVCSSESFSQQFIAPNCSGFLIAPDILITAGHCYKAMGTPEANCKSNAWVFGYEMKAPMHDPTKKIASSNIYLCKEVLAAELNSTLDYAIIKLDRPVAGRAPLKFRTAGRISSSTSLVVIGHPTGLPTKVSSAGKVTKNTESTRFSTTLDTFAGNSGSAVFDATTGQIEGILIQGKSDYQPSNLHNPQSCLVINRCDENANNCTAGYDDGEVQWGEVVLRIESIASKISMATRYRPSRANPRPLPRP